jgi:two-component system chemotaxis sensor kinase CheA
MVLSSSVSSPVAEHAGAQVSVSVRDDGAGLDAGRIRAKAEEKGLVAPGAARCG